MKIGASILAGGKSTRFNGENKALINFSGKSILDRNIDTLQAFFDEIHIISKIAEDYAYSGIPVFADVYDNIGPLGGIYTALLNSKCKAVFIFSCDMPFLSVNIIKNTISRFLDNDCQILIPRILNKIEPLHAVYSTSLITSLENHIKTTSEYKIRLFFPKVNTLYIEFENSKENQKAFLNINSPDDLKSITNSI